MPKKILYVIGTLELGGAESQMTLLISELIAKGWRCDLFVLEDRGPLRTALESHEIKIHCGGYDSSRPRWCKPLRLGGALCRLWLLILREKPDIVHAYLPLTNFFGALAGRMAGARLIITSRRALGVHQDRYRLWKPFDHIANALSDFVTVNSRAVENDTVARDGVNRRKLVLIYNGLDVTRFDAAAVRRDSVRTTLGLNAQVSGIIAVGNLISYKGHADLLQALPDIIKAGHEFHLFLVGEDRGIGSDLLRMAGALGVTSHVSFLGRRNDVADLMAAADIFVMPSHEEGFSNALLEAMGSGLAVVATDVGGNREALADGKLGILVPAKAPVALADAVKRLLGDKSLRFALGHQAKQCVRAKYPVDAMVDAHVRLYQK